MFADFLGGLSIIETKYQSNSVFSNAKRPSSVHVTSAGHVKADSDGSATDMSVGYVKDSSGGTSDADGSSESTRDADRYYPMSKNAGQSKPDNNENGGDTTSGYEEGIEYEENSEGTRGADGYYPMSPVTPKGTGTEQTYSMVALCGGALAASEKVNLEVTFFFVFVCAFFCVCVCVHE